MGRNNSRDSKPDQQRDRIAILGKTGQQIEVGDGKFAGGAQLPHYVSERHRIAIQQRDDQRGRCNCSRNEFGASDCGNNARPLQEAANIFVHLGGQASSGFDVGALRIDFAVFGSYWPIGMRPVLLRTWQACYLWFAIRQATISPFALQRLKGDAVLQKRAPFKQEIGHDLLEIAVFFLELFHPRLAA